MKKLLLGIGVSLMFLLGSCTAEPITEDKIKRDVIGESCVGYWNFDLSSEIRYCELHYVGYNKDKAEAICTFGLEDFRNKNLYILKTNIIYEKENGKWKIYKIVKLSYERDYSEEPTKEEKIKYLKHR
jgi:hypothetical protein